MKNSNKKIKEKKLKKDHKSKIGNLDIIIFLEIILIFGVALLAFFPGLVTADNVDQISQAMNNSYVPAHPIAHSFFIGNLTKLGGIWVPALVQIIIFAFSWTYICKKLRDYNDSVGNKIFQVIFTAVICILPLNYLYAICLWKDIVYSYAMLALVAMIYIGIKENFNYKIGQIILITLSSVIIMKFRYNGEPIGKIMLAILFLLNAFKSKNKKQILSFIISTVVFFCAFSMPHWIYNKTSSSVKITSSNFRSTRIYCMGKLLNCGIQLEDNEKEFLNNVMDIEEWKEDYNPYTAMKLMYSENLHEDFLTQGDNEEKFNKIFDKYAKQHPEQVVDHFLSINSIWLSTVDSGYSHNIIIDNFYVSNMNGGLYDNKPIIGRANAKLGNWAIKTLSNRHLMTIIYKPIIYIVITAVVTIILIVRAIKHKEKGWIFYVLLSFPMLMNIGTYIFLMISQDLRYFYPTFLTGYFMMLVMGTIIFKKKKKNKLNVKNNTKDPKVLVVVPAYNEAENIQKAIKDIKDNCKFDYVIVNDCSKDKTAEVCKKNNFNVISLPINYGLTSGIQLGMKYAMHNDYDIVIQFDGDGQHQAKYLNNLVEDMCKNNYDIVIGSRFVKAKKEWSSRMIGSRILTTLIKLVTGVRINDPTSGMRAYSKRAIYEFCENSSLTPEPDTMVYMLKSGYKVHETQVKMKEREFGTSYLSPLKSIKYMLNMIISILFTRSIG